MMTPLASNTTGTLRPSIVGSDIASGWRRVTLISSVPGMRVRTDADWTIGWAAIRSAMAWVSTSKT